MGELKKIVGYGILMLLCFVGIVWGFAIPSIPVGAGFGLLFGCFLGLFWKAIF